MTTYTLPLKGVGQAAPLLSPESSASNAHRCYNLTATNTAPNSATDGFASRNFKRIIVAHKTTTSGSGTAGSYDIHGYYDNIGWFIIGTSSLLATGAASSVVHEFDSRGAERIAIHLATTPANFTSSEFTLLGIVELNEI